MRHRDVLAEGRVAVAHGARGEERLHRAVVVDDAAAVGIPPVDARARIGRRYLVVAAGEGAAAVAFALALALAVRGVPFAFADVALAFTPCGRTRARRTHGDHTDDDDDDERERSHPTTISPACD